MPAAGARRYRPDVFELAENLDGVLAAILFVVWSAAAVAVGRAARTARVLLVVALAGTAAKVLTVALLWAVGWDFASNRVVVQMPLLLVPVTVVGWRSLRDAGSAGHRVVRVPAGTVLCG
jgi:hypothetical protein